MAPSQAISASPRIEPLKRIDHTPANNTCMAELTSSTNTGVTTAAVSSFESTTSVSETGSDFQNRMLRSLRSCQQRIQ